MIQVLVVDDQALIREGIASLLGIQEGIEVVGSAADGQEALEKVQTLSPELVLMDVRMPIMDGVQATALICSQFPACHVLMLTTFDDEDYIIRALQAGARGYLLKDIPAGNLAQAIRLAHIGIYPLDPSVTRKLLAATHHSEMKVAHALDEANSFVSPHHLLTDREIDVLRLIALGATNREIAAQLVVSEGTVKNHVSNILSHLGLRDRTQAALYAHEHHLI